MLHRLLHNVVHKWINKSESFLSSQFTEKKYFNWLILLCTMHYALCKSLCSHYSCDTRFCIRESINRIPSFFSWKNKLSWLIFLSTMRYALGCIPKKKETAEYIRNIDRKEIGSSYLFFYQYFVHILSRCFSMRTQP